MRRRAGAAVVRCRTPQAARAEDVARSAGLDVEATPAASPTPAPNSRGTCKMRDPNSNVRTVHDDNAPASVTRRDAARREQYQHAVENGQAPVLKLSEQETRAPPEVPLS